MSRTLTLWVVLLVSFGRGAPAAQEGRRPLLPGPPTDREMAAGESHTYALDLVANQIARVVVEQKGIDLVVSVDAPDNVKLFDVDSPNGASGDEIIEVAAPRAGTYRVEVRALDRSAVGRYAIRLDKFLTEREYVVERLAGVGRLWGVVKFFHPFLAHKTVDWDGALVRAIPEIEAARTPDAYRAAVARMLEPLGDAATTVEMSIVESQPAPAAGGVTRPPQYFRLVDGYVVVNVLDWVRRLADGNATPAGKQQELMVEISHARGVVLDCRYGDEAGGGASSDLGFHLNLYLHEVAPFLVKGPVPLGTERYRLHNGYAPQRGQTSGGYVSAFLTESAAVLAGQATAVKPLVVLVDDQSPELLPLLSGLQATGAPIVRVGRTPSSTGAHVLPMTLPDGLRVSIRVAEFVHPDGGSVFEPDVQLTTEAGAGERGIAASIATLSAPTRRPTSSIAHAAAAPIVMLKDDPYSQMAFPPEEYRLLGLFRFWNVLHYFYPYKQLLDAPWSTVLTDFIPRFMDNRSALDYQTTVAEMVARMQDSHGFVRGLDALDQQLGAFAPPIRLGSAGGALTVVELTDAAAAAAGLRVGDVVVAIDGEPVAQRIAALAKLRALSTPQAAHAFIYPSALRGEKDSRVTVRMQRPDGPVRDVELVRTVPLSNVAGRLARKTAIYQIMPSGYGYVDLARLPLADAQKAMDAVQATPALIFDMRGYPNGTAWAIAPRLTARSHVTAALFRRPLQAATALEFTDMGNDPPDYAFSQQVPPPGGSTYMGKVVVLINEHAISQSEHTCLFIESVTDATFIGSPTNGANGDVTNLTLPGNISVNFSGHDVRHADGRQLQRMGIQPHVKVEPTPKGLSEGRDEVLEAAVKYLHDVIKK